MTPRLMDRSLEAIRARAEESVVWPEGEVPMRVSDQLWAAKQDVRTLLELLAAPAAPAAPALDVERLAEAWENVDPRPVAAGYLSLAGVIAAEYARLSGRGTGMSAETPRLDYARTWAAFEQYEASYAKLGFGVARDQMLGAAMMLGWLCNLPAALAAALAELDVERLAAAAQDHETSGIHGPLHCSLACGATIAAEYARLANPEKP